MQIHRAYVVLASIALIGGDSTQAEQWLARARALEAEIPMAHPVLRAGGVAEIKGMFAAGPNVQTNGMPSGNPEDHAILKPALREEQRSALEARAHQLAIILADSFNDWGTAEALDGNVPGALQRFLEAEQWQPDSVTIQRNIGLAAFKMGDYRQAQRAMQWVSQRDPTDRAAAAILKAAAEKLSAP